MERSDDIQVSAGFQAQKSGNHRENIIQVFMLLMITKLKLFGIIDNVLHTMHVTVVCQAFLAFLALCAPN